MYSRTWVNEASEWVYHTHYKYPHTRTTPALHVLAYLGERGERMSVRRHRLVSGDRVTDIKEARADVQKALWRRGVVLCHLLEHLRARQRDNGVAFVYAFVCACGCACAWVCVCVCVCVCV